MKTCLRLAVGTAAAAVAVLVAGCAAPQRTAQERRDLAQMVIGNWSNPSRLSAAKFIEQYGPPDRVESSRLIWDSKGPWKRTEVGDATPDYDSYDGAENLEQTVSYFVPASQRKVLVDFGVWKIRIGPSNAVATSQRKALAAFRGGVHVSKDGMELSSRSHSEELNYLTLNLADAMLKGRINSVQARSIYDTTIQLSKAGKTSPYMQGLLFLEKP